MQNTVGIPSNLSSSYGAAFHSIETSVSRKDTPPIQHSSNHSFGNDMTHVFGSVSATSHPLPDIPDQSTNSFAGLNPTPISARIPTPSVSQVRHQIDLLNSNSTSSSSINLSNSQSLNFAAVQTPSFYPKQSGGQISDNIDPLLFETPTQGSSDLVSWSTNKSVSEPSSSSTQRNNLGAQHTIENRRPKSLQNQPLDHFQSSTTITNAGSPARHTAIIAHISNIANQDVIENDFSETVNRTTDERNEAAEAHSLNGNAVDMESMKGHI